MNVLLTGATGFLGTWIARELVKKGNTVFALVRSQKALDAQMRLARLWHHDKMLLQALGSQIVAIEGDITLNDLGLSQSARELLYADIDAIVHTAADVSINRTVAQTRTTNVEGTRNILSFALSLNEERPLKRFVHISTAYVAGTRDGLVLESESFAPGFNSSYEQSKFEAEALIREAGDKLPISIMRPTQIVGDSQTGEIFTFNTVYYPLKMYLKGKLRLIPARPDAKLSIVPVDYAARAVVAALKDETAAGKTFHVTLPHELQPSIEELVEAVRSWALQNLDIELARPLYTPLPFAAQAGSARNLNQQKTANAKGFAANMLALAPYFSDTHVFDTTNMAELPNEEPPKWREFLPNLLAYATQHGFLNHTGRTVFEQMQTRLAARRNPITYHDIGRDGECITKAPEMHERIRMIAAALMAVGIAQGDRIALVGINSSEYTAVDSAIGLIGATSVPLYYTSPATDIAELTQRSQSKLLFVGTPTLAQAASQGAFSIPCVLMPGAEQDANMSTEDGMLTSWETFMDIGRFNAELLENMPAANLDDIATIRYTSGTTGLPKGTMFTHDQIAWMGKTMPEILDWQTRNAPLRYLSFLPMSHVVEGILVAYAGYYILRKVDYYCLNDFDMLVETLPKVRPTIFFSVPRFYEKLWNQFIDSSAGKRWLAMPEGLAKDAYESICRAVILRKAGLDKCRQLIVGSAPIRNELLMQFRALGIEIHNAYGLTEAPLITLNRLGNNEIGSLGALLPQTEARIDKDGEIYLKGPQLFVGYDGVEEPQTDENGWFATGDLGHFSYAGNLVIEGRRKELVVTSWGKNVQSEKIEALLKSIPGVSEAMLIGDGRPYCTALIWLEDEARPAFDAGEFDMKVLALSEQLSHPEQPKRWSVMEDAPSLSNGELTPNLKLRRKVIAEHNSQAIEALYADKPSTVPGAMHVGEAS